MTVEFLPRTALPAAVACLLLLAQAAHARPAYSRALADYLGSFLAGGVNACKTCHRADRPTEEDHAHNPFGARLVLVRAELRKAGEALGTKNPKELRCSHSSSHLPKPPAATFCASEPWGWGA